MESALKIPCSNAPYLSNKLANEYGEAVRSGGLSGEHIMIQVWSNEETGTWSILMVTSEGQECVIASGKEWEFIDAKPKGPAL